MIYVIAFMIAAYAVARLIQVPLEHGDATTPRGRYRKQVALTLVSAAAILVIAYLASIAWKSATTPSWPNDPQNDPRFR